MASFRMVPPSTMEDFCTTVEPSLHEIKQKASMLAWEKLSGGFRGVPWNPPFSAVSHYYCIILAIHLSAGFSSLSSRSPALLAREQSC